MMLSTISFSSQAQEIKWMRFNDAVNAQKKNKKPIFMDVYTPWCGPCKLLDKQTFSDPKVIKYINENFNPVKFNAEGNEEITFNKVAYTNKNYDERRKNSRNSMHDFADFLKVPGYPAMVIIYKNGKNKQIIGFKSPDELLKEI